MIILRLTVMLLAGLLSVTGLVLVVVAVLAAQWLAVAVVVLAIMGMLWAGMRAARLILGSSGTGAP